MKYRGLRSKCQVCGKTGLAQLFLNKEGTIRYARVRHFTHNNVLTHKPQFSYCKIENLDILKDLLKTQTISLTTEKALDGQVGQAENDDLVKPESSLNQQNICGRRLVWFRTLAFQANDHGFKSRRPHHNLLSHHFNRNLKMPNAIAKYASATMHIAINNAG